MPRVFFRKHGNAFFKPHFLTLAVWRCPLHIFLEPYHISYEIYDARQSPLTSPSQTPPPNTPPPNLIPFTSRRGDSYITTISIQLP